MILTLAKVLGKAIFYLAVVIAAGMPVGVQSNHIRMKSCMAFLNNIILDMNN